MKLPIGEKGAPIHGVPKSRLAKDYRAELQSLQSVDDLVEAVVDALKQAGKLDNTLIVYTSDNGFLYGQHRLIGKSAAYEESIKVPLVMRGPGIPKGETRAALVNNLDVVATVAELAGASPGYALDGRSLTPLFADARGTLAERSPHRKPGQPLPEAAQPLHRSAHRDAEICEI